MSAWVVEKGHIDIIVNALAQFGVVPHGLPRADYQAIGQTLWHENHQSVNYRYDRDTTTPLYRLRTTTAGLDPLRVLKAINCYTYRSCEHLGWESSEAHTLTDRLHNAILDEYPDIAAMVRAPDGRENHRYTTLAGYEHAPWGFESLGQAVLATEPGYATEECKDTAEAIEKIAAAIVEGKIMGPYHEAVTRLEYLVAVLDWNI